MSLINEIEKEIKKFNKYKELIKNCKKYISEEDYNQLSELLVIAFTKSIYNKVKKVRDKP